MVEQGLLLLPHSEGPRFESKVGGGAFQRRARSPQVFLGALVSPPTKNTLRFVHTGRMDEPSI